MLFRMTSIRRRSRRRGRRERRANASGNADGARNGNGNWNGNASAGNANAKTTADDAKENARVRAIAIALGNGQCDRGLCSLLFSVLSHGSPGGGHMYYTKKRVDYGTIASLTPVLCDGLTFWLSFHICQKSIRKNKTWPDDKWGLPPQVSVRFQ